MSWKGGSNMMSSIISIIEPNVSDFNTRVEIYSGLIEIFEQEDCDTLYECLNEDPAFDEAYEESNPEYFSNEEDYEELE